MSVVALFALSASARETGRIELTLLDEDGRPRAGEWVCLERAPASPCRWRRTDERGVVAYEVRAGREYRARTADRWLTTPVAVVSVPAGGTEARELRAIPDPHYLTYETLGRSTSPFVSLPLGRSLDAVLLTVPGVVPTRDGLSMNGAAPDENTWLVDGIDLTDPVSGTWDPAPAGPTAPPGLPPAWHR
jgi:hypothetical protein